MKKRSFYISTALFLFGLFLFSSFQQNEQEAPLSKQEMIDLKVNEKYEEYVQNEIEKCRLDGLEAAQIYVDSLIRTPGFIFKNDTINIPRPPNKPAKPNLNSSDYKKAKPIFEN